MKPDLIICRNVEWVRENSGLDLSTIYEAEQNDAASSLISETLYQFQRLGYDIRTPENPGYHKWDGTKFVERYSLVASWDKFDPNTKKQIIQTINNCISTINRIYCKYNY